MQGPVIIPATLANQAVVAVVFSNLSQTAGDRISYMSYSVEVNNEGNYVDGEDNDIEMSHFKNLKAVDSVGGSVLYGTEIIPSDYSLDVFEATIGLLSAVK